MYEFAVTPAVTQLRRPGVTIDSVARGSLADEVGLEKGDRIVKVNGRPVRDYLDFRFQSSGETELLLLVRKSSGESWEIDLERDEGEDLGLEFEQIVPRQCANECLFCFCKGNPEDARPSLFVRDEDIRLSFLYGNYTTLSSITEDEMTRIVEQRLSPQYVSVHATDLATRAYLLGVSEERADISDKLERLLSNGIEIHAQVVLCPGINDGEQLEKTLRDLAALHPKVVSTAIVPVALTRYNNDERLKRVDADFCRRTIGEVEKLQAEFSSRLGTNFAFLGDEIYLKAGADIPVRSHYGDYPQIEDGVGMVRSFVNRFEDFIASAGDSQNLERGGNPRVNAYAQTPGSDGEKRTPEFPSLRGTIMTGEMFAPVLSDAVSSLNRELSTQFEVLPVRNGYFGGDVAVAGLLSGSDIIRAAKDAAGDYIVVPESVVKSDEDVLIDGITVPEVLRQTDKDVVFTDLDGLFDALGRALN